MPSFAPRRGTCARARAVVAEGPGARRVIASLFRREARVIIITTDLARIGRAFPFFVRERRSDVVHNSNGQRRVPTDAERRAGVALRPARVARSRLHGRRPRAPGLTGASLARARCGAPPARPPPSPPRGDQKRRARARGSKGPREPPRVPRRVRARRLGEHRGQARRAQALRVASRPTRGGARGPRPGPGRPRRVRGRPPGERAIRAATPPPPDLARRAVTPIPSPSASPRPPRVATSPSRCRTRARVRAPRTSGAHPPSPPSPDRRAVRRAILRPSFPRVARALGRRPRSERSGRRLREDPKGRRHLRARADRVPPRGRAPRPRRVRRARRRPESERRREEPRGGRRIPLRRRCRRASRRALARAPSNDRPPRVPRERVRRHRRRHHTPRVGRDGGGGDARGGGRRRLRSSREGFISSEFRRRRLRRGALRRRVRVVFARRGEVRQEPRGTRCIAARRRLRVVRFARRRGTGRGRSVRARRGTLDAAPGDSIAITVRRFAVFAAPRGRPRRRLQGGAQETHEVLFDALAEGVDRAVAFEPNSNRRPPCSPSGVRGERGQRRVRGGVSRRGGSRPIAVGVREHAPGFYAEGAVELVARDAADRGGSSPRRGWDRGAGAACGKTGVARRGAARAEGRRRRERGGAARAGGRLARRARTSSEVRDHAPAGRRVACRPRARLRDRRVGLGFPTETIAASSKSSHPFPSRSRTPWVVNPASSARARAPPRTPRTRLSASSTRWFEPGRARGRGGGRTCTFRAGSGTTGEAGLPAGGSSARRRRRPPIQHRTPPEHRFEDRALAVPPITRAKSCGRVAAV